MRKQSFLSLSVIVMLFLSGCTKENLQDYNPAIPTEDNQQDPYSVSYSEWTGGVNLSWSDGATTEPSRQSDLAVPDLTQEVIDAGALVLVYAKSNVDGTIQAMPAEYSDLSNNEINTYSASSVAGSISLSHTKSVDGAFEVPDDSNEISFRYIIVKPNTPDPNGRPVTNYGFQYMSYAEIVNLLGISE
jgi:hypothetical protein